MDVIEKRRRELYAEMRELNRKMRRVSRELGDLDRGHLPPDRVDDAFIPPFLRAQKPMVLTLRKRRVA
jgi:hypothetical protein